MTYQRRSEAIKAFLLANTWPDLAAMYSKEMEVQVNVAQDGGKLVHRQYLGRDIREYTDDIQTWKMFRIPLKAMLEPEDNDYDLRFDLQAHADGIGMTGWNWIQRKSVWIAYDFDAIVGHSEKHTKKLTNDELAEIQRKIIDIDWITLRRSTSGSGLHVYVYLDVNETINNHNEHMAIGRSVLSQLSAMAGFDFEAKVDVNAGNMWVWHRKMMLPDGTRNPNGLALIKQGSKLTSIPRDWRDYVDVVKGKRRRTVPSFLKGSDAELDLFEELSNQRGKVPLDKDHTALLNWIQENNPGSSYWREDHWMLVTNAHTLKRAHESLKLKGEYSTLSTLDGEGEQNCYAFPLLNGAWTVRRYTRGCAETKTWNQDGQGWTTCVLNRLPDFKLACRLHGGIEKPNGSFVFNEASSAIKAAKMLGGNLSIPDKMAGRTTVLGRHKDQRLIIHLEKETKDTYEGLEGFDGTGKTWTKIFDGKIDQTQPTVDTLGMDKMVRHIVNEGGRDEGWVIRSDSAWRDEPLEHVKIMLRGNFQYKPTEVDQILGTAISQPYKLVNMPFDVEYPPGRLWNRKAARLRFEPSQDLDNLRFPTWIKIMDHLGKNLDAYLKENPWAKAHNISCGAEYLVLWIAAMFQKPYHRAPYLFFFSEPWTNTGKSTFHESITLLMGGDQNFKDAPPYGYMKVNEALKANANFNAELQHSLLCVVEELDLNPKRSDAKISANRIKELVTGNYIGIHEKRQTPCMVRNTTRWVQCANEKTACPIFKDDSRITVIRVNQIDDIDMIPKEQLMEILLKEGPDFLAHLLHLEIPPSNERLIIPAIDTTDKHTIQSANNSVVEQFINENAHHVDGEMIPWSEFFDAFQKWMEPIDIDKWSKHYTGQHLPDQYPKGRRKVDRQYCVGNISWVRPEPGAPVKQRLVLKDECLVPIGGAK